MSDQALYARVEAILIDVLMIEDAARVKPEAQIVRDLGAESINIAEIAVAIENEFGITVEDDAIQKGATVNDLVGYVEKSLSGK